MRLTRRTVSVICALTIGYGIALADSDSGNPLPGEAEMRFQQGLRLAADNQDEAAIRIFSQLTADYPLLPQPHVQLAALFVKQGQLPRATNELRAALEHRLDDGRLQESLGDLYVELARQSYRGAMDAATPGPGAASKYVALQKLDSSPMSKAAAGP